MTAKVSNQDIPKILARISSELGILEGKKIAILGSSGFIGSWIVEILKEAMNRGLSCDVSLISRSESSSPKKNSGALKNALRSFKVDIAEGLPFEILDSDYFLLAATSSTPHHGSNDAMTIRKTTQGLLSFLESLGKTHFNTQKNLVHLSSGAVYSVHKKTRHKYPESEELAPFSSDAYTNSKLQLEEATRRLALTNSKWNIANPRLFTLYGPGLPLDAHFAIGNFIGAGIRGEDILISGDPSTERSYLHIADLCVAIFKVLLAPISDPLNLGSSLPISMKRLAELVAAEFPSSRVRVKNNQNEASFYVPETSQTISRIGEFDTTDLATGIREWIKWLVQ